jgi:hypothetical protein
MIGDGLMNKSRGFGLRLVLVALLAACTGVPAPAPQTTPVSVPTSPTAPLATTQSQLRLSQRWDVAGCFTMQDIEGYPTDLQPPGLLIHDPDYKVLFFYVYFDAQTPGRNPSTDFFILMDSYFAVQSEYVGFVFGDASPRFVDGYEGNVRSVSGKIPALQDIGRFVTITFKDGDQFLAMAWASSPATRDAWPELGNGMFETMLDTVRFEPGVGTAHSCLAPEDMQASY